MSAYILWCPALTHTTHHLAWTCCCCLQHLLEACGRSHNVQDIAAAIAAVKEAGFQAWNLDLISGGYAKAYPHECLWAACYIMVQSLQSRYHGHHCPTGRHRQLPCAIPLVPYSASGGTCSFAGQLLVKAVCLTCHI
jgi:hypothetical protein